jgi:hypothetical protein
MAETNKAKFLSTTFQLKHGEMSFELKGLASEVGITKIHVVSRPPPHVEEVLEKPAVVQLGSLSLKAVLVKNFAEGGSIYEVRFAGMHDTQKAFLRNLLATQGVHPGWVRKHPRIPVKESETTGLPTVNACVLRFMGQEHFLPVINFSIGGVRVQLDQSEAWKEARVGMTLHFDLLTNDGEVLPRFSGEIRNISMLEPAESGDIHPVKTLGIGFSSMDGKLRNKFYEVIRHFCREAMKLMRGSKASGE